jgi:diguanylate cyclase (GGDEF)-like protein
MALILPGTSRNTAAAIAETICRAVAAKQVPLGDGKTLSVTASLGVAAFEPGGVLAQPAHLIKAADLALYTAKKSGRNCVKVFSPPTKAQVKPAA